MDLPSIKHKALSGLGWIMVAKFTGQAFSWASTFIMVRLLMPEDYGLNGMANVAFNMLMILSSSGMADGLVRARTADDRTVRSLLGFLIVINFILFAIQFFAAPFMAAYFNEPRLESISKVMAVAFLLMPWIIIPQALLTRELEFKIKSGVDFTANMATVIISLGLAYRGYGVWALIFGQLTNLVIQSIGLNLAKTIPKIPYFNFQGIGHFVGFGGVVAIGSILWGLYCNVDVVIGGRLLETNELGYYVTALQLAAMPMIKIMPIIVQVAFPFFCQMRSERDRVIWYFRRSLRLAALFSFPVFFGLGGIAPQFVPLILGERWRPMVATVMILCFSIPFRLVINLFSPAVKALGKPWLLVINSMVILVALTVGCVYGARWGAEGLASAWLVAAAFSFLVTVFSSAKTIGLKIRDVFVDLLPPFIVGLTMFVLVYNLYLYFEIELGYENKSEILAKIAELTISVTVGVVFYTTLTLAAFPRRAREVVEIWRNRNR